MGISGLLPLLKEAQVHGNISAFKGKRLAVDAYVWLHKGAFGCAEDLAKGTKSTKFVDYAMHRVRMLRHYGITPFIVFDGGPLPAKKGTEVSRAKSRAENLARAIAAEGQGRSLEARDCYTKCVDITPEMAYQLIKALRAEQVDYIVAPYEADAQLCFLERHGFVDGIITEDSDLLVFGCKQVIFKLDKNGDCVNIHRDRLAHVAGAPMHGWTGTDFRRMAMLSGCDYLPSLPGVGIKTAHKLLRRFKTVEKLLQHLRLEGARVPDNYVASFNQAELAFLHQRVYDPDARALRPLAPFPEGGLQEDDERWIGLDLEPAIAEGIAKGDLHPETREPIEDQWPHFQPAARNVASSGKTPAGPLATISSNTPTARGPMDAFITRSKQPIPSPALPRPVGVDGSGPSRLSDLVTRSAPPVQLKSAPRKHSNGPGCGLEAEAAQRALRTVKSKFFGGGTQPARPVREAPSPDKKEGSEVNLMWEASSEGGPEVEFDETQTRTPGGPDTHRESGHPRGTERDGGLMAEEWQGSMPVTPHVAPNANRHPQSHQPLTSPGAPLLSSPPAESLSPLKAGPSRRFAPSSPMAEPSSHRYSSPPDIGRQRSLTADPFSPSPSPRATKRHSPPSDGLVAVDLAIGTQLQVTASVFTQLSSQAVRASSPPASSPSMAIPSRVPDSQGTGWATQSSDAHEDEAVVTPSFDLAYAVPAGQGVRVRVREQDRDEIQVSSDEEDVVRIKVETERRKERAQVVSAGWKQRFSLQSPLANTSRSPAASASRPIKRRKTDPSPALVPSSPISPVVPLAAQAPNMLHTRSVPSIGRIDSGLHAPASKPGRPAPSRTGSASKAPIPLSACAPRFFMTARSAGKLPPSPAQVKQDRQAEAKARELVASIPPASYENSARSDAGAQSHSPLQLPHTPTTVRAVEGKEGRSAVARFRYSGAVPDLKGRSWL